MKHLHPEQLIKDVMQQFAVSEREAKKAIEDTHGQPEEYRKGFILSA